MGTKFISTIAALSLTATTSLAGGMAEPIVMAPVEIADVAEEDNDRNLIIPLIILALVFAAAQQGGETDPFADSDMRVKTDIVPVGVAENGLTIYQYRYTGFSPVFEGVMAQDVLMHTPEAVTLRPSGTYAVNYGMLGLELKLVE